MEITTGVLQYDAGTGSSILVWKTVENDQNFCYLLTIGTRMQS
jgi:hypothetical protein